MSPLLHIDRLKGNCTLKYCSIIVAYNKLKIFHCWWFEYFIARYGGTNEVLASKLEFCGACTHMYSLLDMIWHLIIENSWCWIMSRCMLRVRLCLEPTSKLKHIRTLLFLKQSNYLTYKTHYVGCLQEHKRCGALFDCEFYITSSSTIQSFHLHLLSKNIIQWYFWTLKRKMFNPFPQVEGWSSIHFILFASSKMVCQFFKTNGLINTI